MTSVPAKRNLLEDQCRAGIATSTALWLNSRTLANKTGAPSTQVGTTKVPFPWHG